MNITANNKTVPNVHSLTLLGVTLVPSLKWDHYIDNVIRRANSKRYFLVVLRRAGVSTEHLVCFYTTFIRPTLEYAAPVWQSESGCFCCTLELAEGVCHLMTDQEVKLLEVTQLITDVEYMARVERVRLHTIYQV